MDFIAFLIVNAILFLRPSEIVPELARVPLYYFAMLACLSFSILHLMKLFFYSPLIKHPTVIFSFLMFLFAGISLAINKEPGEAIDAEIEFLKIITYFCLFLAIVRTPGRLQGVIAWVVACMTVTAVLAILHFHEIIKIDILKIQEELLENKSNWTEEVVRRLRFTGILHDANEVGVFVSVLIFLCAYHLTNRQVGLVRFIWAAPIGIFLYSLFLTRSRGGLLALLAGMTVFAVYGFYPKNKFGAAAKIPVKGLAFLGICVPLLLIAGGSRQTDISTNAATAQTRFGLWSDWLQEFRGSPLVGVGPNIAAREEGSPNSGSYEGAKLCAHNSYLQPFADLGFLGGLSFLGAMGYALITVHRYGFNKTIILDPALARMQPYLMAALSVCALGFLTLSLNYVLPTYFILALPVAYYGMTACYPPIERPTLTLDSLTRLALAGVGFLTFTYVMVRVMPKQ